MRPYEHKKLEEFPDVADIQAEGRKSSVGKLAGKSGSYKPYNRKRKATRRHIKRADKAKAARLLKEEEQHKNR